MMKIKLSCCTLLFIACKLSAQISITFTNVVQPCNSNGSATAVVTGGVQPYTYNWVEVSDFPQYISTISTTNNISNAHRATYYLTVTDVNNQQKKDTLFLHGQVCFLHDTVATFTWPEKVITVNANCPTYQGNLSATIAGSNPPYTFSFMGTIQTTSLTSYNATHLSIGTYTCTVMDNTGCTDTVPVNVSSSPGYYVNITSRPDTCTSNGMATAIPTGGGKAPFTYLWNTTPPQNTKTATGLSSYNYSNSFPQVTVTDANGCVATNSAYIQDSITLHSIQSVASIQNAACGQSNGYVAIRNSGGIPPYTYAWSTGATTDSIYNLSPGTYIVTVSDAAGCHEKFIKQVASISPVNTSLSITNTDCNNSGGAITALPSGGTSPYTFQWSNGQNASSITNLVADFYSVGVRDANGCYSWAGDSVSNPINCVAKISGQVINDMNGNCILDGNESGLPQQIIELSNGALYYSYWDGTYFFPPVLNPTGTYIVSQTTKSPWSQVCPAAALALNPTAGNTYINNNFYDKPNPLYTDLQVYVVTDSCRPGFTFNQWVSVFNNGTSTMTGTANLQHDALLTVISTGGASAYNSSTHTFTFSFNNLAPMTWTSFNVQLRAPANTTLFTPLTSYAVANPLSGDVNPLDNYDTLHYRVTGSYDPNAKSVKPEGTGINGYISTVDSVLKYTIHFQNTGSYPTNMVSVIDTIDSNLDIYSLKIAGSYTGGDYNGVPNISFLAANIIKFTYNYCYLQPATWDIANSSGFITYSIKQKKNLSKGTQIKNRADIYFDYNTPVLTNSTLNTINSFSSINSIHESNNLMIYPNPNNGIFDIEPTTTTKQTVQIFDVTGKVLLNQVIYGKISIDASNLNDGVYTISIIGNEGVINKRIVIVK